MIKSDIIFTAYPQIEYKIPVQQWRDMEIIRILHEIKKDVQNKYATVYIYFIRGEHSVNVGIQSNNDFDMYIQIFINRKMKMSTKINIPEAFERIKEAVFEGKVTKIGE